MTLDGGSAAPATPDVLRTPDCWLAEPEFDGIDVLDPDGWRGATGRLWTDPISRAEFRARLWRSTITGPVRGLGHSGVAGERSDSLKASEGSEASAPTPGHSPDPVIPSVELSTGCVVVPDEAVEAAARADHAFGRLGDDPDWDGLTDADRDSYRRAARSYLTAAASLIAAQALRQAAEALAAQVAHTISSGWGGVDRINGSGDAAVWLQRRADELERGGDQPEPAADDGPTASERDDLAVVIAGRIDHAQRMGAAVLANALLDAGYRRVGGDHG